MSHKPEYEEPCLLPNPAHSGWNSLYDNLGHKVPEFNAGSFRDRSGMTIGPVRPGWNGH
jgi:hypothetical protein